MLVQLILLSIVYITNKDDSSYIDNFDISPDDKSIVFAYYRNDKPSIYLSGIDGQMPIQIVGSKNEVNYTNPRFSPDGKKILFIKYTDYTRSTLCMAELDGSGIQELTDGKDIITEAIFSKQPGKILFCKALEYAKYSPSGASVPLVPFNFVLEFVRWYSK